MEHDLNILMIFGMKEKLIILSTNIVTNIPVLLMTAAVPHIGLRGGEASSHAVW